MGRNSKLTVRAQRKYAHKAYIPGAPYRSDAEPPEPEQAVPLQPVLKKACKPVNNLLDQMAFQNIHEHSEKKKNLKDVRVVLKRLQPAEAQNVAAPQNAPEPVPLVAPEPVPQPAPQPAPKPASKPAQKPAPVITQPSTSQSQQMGFRRKRKNKKRKSSTSVIITNLNRLNLRTRAIARNWLVEETAKQAMLAAKANRGPCLRRVSETSTEDNRPLTYFAKTNKNKPVRSKRKQGPATRKSLRKTVVKETSHKKKSKNQVKNNNTDRSVIICGSSAHMQNVTGVPLSASEQNFRKLLYAPSISDVIKLERECSVIIEDTQLQSEIDFQDQSQPNSLADFVIKIFNNNKGDNIAQDEGNEMQNSLLRVQEWLVCNSVEENQTDPEFKMPSRPRWRTARAPSLASSITSLPASITVKEMSLRSRCLAWNYKTLSDIFEKKHLIRRFCGDCTRCRVMFKLEDIQKPSCNSARPSSALLTDTSDIYEFTSGRDDAPSTLPYRGSNNWIFSQISTGTDHIQKLNQIMTDKGKKILKAATIIKRQVEENGPLLQKEHSILAQVIGILNESNAARMTEPPQSARLTLSHSNKEPPRPPPRRRCTDVISIPSSSKRQRRSVTPECPPQEPALPTPVRESRKFSPTAAEFNESPITFVSAMQWKYRGISLCGIKPPQGFKPKCGNGDVDVNFKISNQYIHRMLNRWGDATSQLTAIRSTQDPKMQRSPLFEGLEVDLVKLFLTVQSENGIEACQNNSEKWQVVAKKMKLFCRGKANTKLENIYLKYLLGYNTLTSEERERVRKEVNECWSQREVKCVRRAQHPLWRQEDMRKGQPLEDINQGSYLEKVCAEAEECVTPGRYINYNSFKKLALQVQETYFPDNPDPSPEEVERQYWDIVISADAHVCVHAASVDAAEHKLGFADDSSDPYANHPWNLKRLRLCSKNLLSYLGPSLGVSSTSIHYGMMFSTSCWHMDPTNVPWIEYLHHGAPKIWYSISADQEHMFRAAAEALYPFAVLNKAIWLPCDIIMIPPVLLSQYGITVERHVQHPGEFVVVYPNTYCACVDTGLTVSEGVYFAPHNWLMDIEKIFLNLRNSCEPSLFSMEKLLIAMAQNTDTPTNLLQRVHTVLNSVLYDEISYRQDMADRNVELMTPEVFLEQNLRATRSSWQIQTTGECSYCRRHLHLTRVVGLTEGQTGLCSMHGVHLFDAAMKREKQLSNVFCILLISNEHIYNTLKNLKKRMLSLVDVST